jgi:hypothetical protein
MKTRTKIKNFTLLEIILVVAILSMVASVVGWQIARLVKSYAFQAEVEEIYRAIKQAQVLSLSYQTDISVRFSKEEGLHYYYLHTDEPFAEIPFDREKKALQKVRRITFNRKPIHTFDFCLYSNGDMEPRGLLGFFPDKKKEEPAMWLDFQGAFMLALTHQKPETLKERSPTYPEDQLKKFHAKKSSGDSISK